MYSIVFFWKKQKDIFSLSYLIWFIWIIDFKCHFPSEWYHTLVNTQELSWIVISLEILIKDINILSDFPDNVILNRFV